MKLPPFILPKNEATTTRGNINSRNRVKGIKAYTVKAACMNRCTYRIIRRRIYTESGRLRAIQTRFRLKWPTIPHFCTQTVHIFSKPLLNFKAKPLPLPPEKYGTKFYFYVSSSKNSRPAI